MPVVGGLVDRRRPPQLVGRLSLGLVGFFAFPCPYMNIIVLFGKDLEIYSIQGLVNYTCVV